VSTAAGCYLALRQGQPWGGSSYPRLGAFDPKRPFAKGGYRPEADVGISSAFDGWQPPSLIFTFLDFRAIGAVQQLFAFSIPDDRPK